MGFLDVLRGKRELKQPAPDRLFAMSTANVNLDLELGLHSSGKAAIVFQPLATADFDGIVRDMEEVVRGTGEETGTTLETHDDSFGYRWMVLRDPDIEDLAVGVNAVSEALQLGGYGERVEDPAELPAAFGRAFHAVNIEKRQALLNVICQGGGGG